MVRVCKWLAWCICAIAGAAICLIAYQQRRRERFRCYSGTFDRTINSARAATGADRRARSRTDRLASFLTGCDTEATSKDARASAACPCASSGCATLCDSPDHKYPKLCRDHGRLQCILDALPVRRDISPLCKRKDMLRAHKRRLCPASRASETASAAKKDRPCSNCRLPILDRFPTPSSSTSHDDVCIGSGGSGGTFACAPPSTQMLYSVTTDGAVGNDTADKLVAMLP